MGCITANITCNGDGLKAGVTAHDRGLSATVGMIGRGLSVSVGIMCKANRDAYLHVEPEVIWLTSDTMGVDFCVKSNTRWKIE